MDIPPPYNKNINSATTRAASSNYLSVDMRNSVRGEANNAGPPLRINNEQHPKPALTDEQIGKEGASVLVCVVVYSVLFTLDQLGKTASWVGGTLLIIIIILLLQGKLVLTSLVDFLCDPKPALKASWHHWKSDW